MNKEIMRKLGFKKEMDRVERGHCPMCNKEIAIDEFRDEQSKKEFGISGLCQNCQDSVFTE